MNETDVEWTLENLEKGQMGDEGVENQQGYKEGGVSGVGQWRRGRGVG